MSQLAELIIGSLFPASDFRQNHRLLFLRALSVMPLLGLPNEVLANIFEAFDSLNDHLSLAQTCKTMYSIGSFVKIDWTLIPISYSITPYKRLVVAVKVRQVADWAVEAADNRQELIKALESGFDGLLKLCCKVSPLKLPDMSLIHSKWLTLVKPLMRCSWHLWSEYPPWHLLDRRLVSATEIITYWTYCNLFHHSFDAILDGSKMEPLSLDTQKAYLAAFEGEDLWVVRHGRAYELALADFRAALMDHSEQAGKKSGLVGFLLQHSGEDWLEWCLHGDSGLARRFYLGIRKSLPRKLENETVGHVKKYWSMDALRAKRVG